MADLRIGEVARRTGLSSSTIRCYERCKLIPPPPRRGGQRCYDFSALARIRAVAGARAAGLGVAAIEAMLGARGSREAMDGLLRRQLDRVEEEMKLLTALRGLIEQLASCGCSGPSDCALGI